MKYPLKSLFAAVLAAGAVVGHAAIVPIGDASFVANAGQITFSETGFGLGTLNPSYAATQFGGSTTVSFGSYFTGQSLGTASDCPALAPNPVTGYVGQLGACVVGGRTAGSSLGSLQLDPNALNSLGAVIVEDPTHSTSALSGTPNLNGAIAMLFGTSQAAISLDAGFLNAIGSTSIIAYGRDGSFLGEIFNTATGIQNLLIGTSDGAAQIAGLLITLVAPDLAGFTIDNIQFGTIRTGGTDPDPPNGTPEPSSLALVGLALLGLGAARRRKITERG